MNPLPNDEQPATIPEATTYTKSYESGGYFDNNPLDYITIKSGYDNVVRVRASLLRAIIQDLTEHDGFSPELAAAEKRLLEAEEEAKAIRTDFLECAANHPKMGSEAPTITWKAAQLNALYARLSRPTTG